jgi:hypothetical protein
MVTQKNCLAIYYNFVIIAAFYDKNVLLSWSLAAVNLADWVRNSDFSCLKELRSGASNNRAGKRRHRRGSTQRIRRAPRPFARPLFQYGECLRSTAVVIFLR